MSHEAGSRVFLERLGARLISSAVAIFAADAGLKDVAGTMNPKELNYSGGEEIHVGDRVMHALRKATVVAVMTRDEYSADFTAEHWGHYERGFLIRDDETGTLYMYENANEDIELISRDKVV